jgi:hypothetical protein
MAVLDLGFCAQTKRGFLDSPDSAPRAVARRVVSLLDVPEVILRLGIAVVTLRTGLKPLCPLDLLPREEIVDEMYRRTVKRQKPLDLGPRRIVFRNVENGYAPGIVWKSESLDLLPEWGVAPEGNSVIDSHSTSPT